MTNTETINKNNIEKNKTLRFLLSGKKPEWFALALFGALYIFTTIFHEPWFDEAQAWQIARCASLKEILFVVPHYEGHPAFWQLILLIPAKLGMPYEPTLKTIGGIIIMAAAYLLLFKSPFKRWFKLLVPFTFFFFYQYGIIVRPYSLLLIFVMLAAISFKERNEKPWLFVLSLLGMCVCSAYGVVLAGGIAMAWVIDILQEKKFKDTLKDVFTTARFASLWVLLISAIAIVLQILPRSDTYALGLDKKNLFIERWICTLFSFLSDSFLTESSATACEVMLNDVQFNYLELALGSLLGLLIWFAIWMSSSKKIFKYFAITYILFATFAAYSYFSSHHLGMVLFILLFWGWINECAEQPYYKWNKAINRLYEKNSTFEAFCKNNKDLFRKTFIFVSVIVLGLNIYWNIRSIVLDVHFQFYYGRGMAEFFEENNLTNLVIVSHWMDEDYDYDGEIEYDTNYVHPPVNIYPYFDDDRFVVNMQEGYCTHIAPSEQEIQEDINAIKACGVPDVLIASVDVGLLTDGEYRMIDYSPVYVMEVHIIWKGEEYPAYDYVYMRNDLIEKYGLTNLYKKGDN